MIRQDFKLRAHAIGGWWIDCRQRTIARITGTGGDQFFNLAGTTNVTDGGLFDVTDKANSFLT